MAEKDAGIFQFEKMVGHIGTIDCPEKGSSAVVRKTSILFLFWLQIYRFLLEIKKICSCFEQYGLTLELCRLTNHLYLCRELKIGK